MKGIALSILTSGFFIAAAIDPPTKEQMNIAGPFLLICLVVTLLAVLLESTRN